MWSTATTFASQPSVAGGLVFDNTNTGVSVFDASGTSGCSGTPRTCSPLWSDPFVASYPVVSDGWLYASTLQSFVGITVQTFRLPDH
jgi:hypothetical protein